MQHIHELCDEPLLLQHLCMNVLTGRVESHYFLIAEKHVVLDPSLWVFPFLTLEGMRPAHLLPRFRAPAPKYISVLKIDPVATIFKTKTNNLQRKK